MKIKKTRVRLKDIHHGAVLYVACPWYGISKVVVVGKPYLSKHTESLFVRVSDPFRRKRSLRDMGITVTEPYNCKRTFKKLKQAEAYVQWGRRDPASIAKQQEHLEYCKWLDDQTEYYDHLDDYYVPEED